MKITDVKTFPLSVPYRAGIKVSFLLVEVSTDEGITGIGEASDCFGHQIPLAAKEVIEGKIKKIILHLTYTFQQLSFPESFLYLGISILLPNYCST